MVPYSFFLVHNDLCILILMYMFIFCRATVLFLDCIKYGNLMILRTWLLTCVKKKDSYPFFKKTQFLSFASISFTSFKKRQFYSVVIFLPVICLVIWCFPIWLTNSLSYLMVIFSANEIWTFYLRDLDGYHFQPKNVHRVLVHHN